jgi:spore coat polysaccharide biosynthesis predicted glycosyltransferase SpsG
VNLGWHGSLAEATVGDKVRQLMRDGDRRRQMSETGQRSVDGRGASRVVEQLVA